MENTLLWGVIGYLLGSIPFGLLLARAQGIDLRQVGSGNIGATNVLRTGKKGMAAATLVLDAAKGAAAVLLAREYGGETATMAAGTAAFLGHCFPVWLGFNGGKGVATMLGVAAAASPVLGAVFAVVWLGGAAVTRYSSVGGMLGAASAPVAAMVLGPEGWWLPLAGMALVLLGRHRENLARLRAGTESRIGGR